MSEDNVKQLLQLIKDLARNMTEINQIDPILLDFSMVFDKVNHFIQVASASGASETTNWIESAGRRQSVVLDRENCDELSVVSESHIH